MEAYYHNHPGMITERTRVQSSRNPVAKKVKKTRDTEAWNEAARKAQKSGDWTRFPEYISGRKRRR
jgi:hypothetical protein